MRDTDYVIGSDVLRLIGSMSKRNYSLAITANQMWEARFFTHDEHPWALDEIKGMTYAEAEGEHPEFCAFFSCDPATAIIGAARLREPGLVADLRVGEE